MTDPRSEARAREEWCDLCRGKTRRIPTSREVMIAGGVDPDAPFKVGPFPAEMRRAAPDSGGDVRAAGSGLRETITAAIAKADDAFGYSFNMTSLVDGVATHTLIMDGYEPVDFEDRDDGYRLIQERRCAARADAVLEALAPASSAGEGLREAFKAGWRTNAVGEDTHSREYLDGCEDVDWEEYQRVGLPQYLASLVSECEVPGCENQTSRGICSDCDLWVSKQAADLPQSPIKVQPDPVSADLADVREIDRALIVAMEDFINEPRPGRDEHPDVRDYRHEAYRVWSPLCRAILAYTPKAPDRAPAPADLVVALRLAVCVRLGGEVTLTFPDGDAAEQAFQSLAALRSPDDLAKGRGK